MGSLGFMTNYRADNYEQVLDGVIKGGFSLTLRSRLQVRVMERAADAEDRVAPPPLVSRCLSVQVMETFQVLNEVVIDRGPSPYLSILEAHVDGHQITTVQGDGIIVSSATGTPPLPNPLRTRGSTAYNLSAGGSIVHPNLPCILFTPICPHSLSFRPLLFPDSSTLRIEVKKGSRSTAWLSLDGRERRKLSGSNYIEITTSKWSRQPLRRLTRAGPCRRRVTTRARWSGRAQSWNRCIGTSASCRRLTKRGVGSVGMGRTSKKISCSSAKKFRLQHYTNTSTLDVPLA
jgi:NAD+ kinase